MLDQMQVTVTTVHVLSALLEHPDVQEGLRDGQECFREGMFREDHEKAWTEEDILQFVEEELSRRRYQREQCISQVMGQPQPSYLHHLGFVISYLDQALAGKAQ